MQPSQDPLVVRLVVAFLGLIALVGLVAITALVWRGADPLALVALTGITGPVIGGLVGILATTTVTPAAVEQRGYDRAVTALAQLAGSTPPPPPGG